MTFKEAVGATPGLSGAYRKGLKALRRADHSYIKCGQPRQITGSIDLDDALKKERPDDPRWDYGVGYRRGEAKEMVFWLEVHPASATRHVNDLIAKADWLKHWLRTEAPGLAELPREFIWVATGTVAFPPGSPHLRRLAQQGIRFEPRRLMVV